VRRRFRNGAELGFTITELLVALTVTVIGLAGLLSLHVTTVRGNASASRSLEANAIAEESLEILRSKTIGDMEQYFGPITTTDVVYHWDGDDGDDSPPGDFGPSVIAGRANQSYRRLVHFKLVDASQPNLIWIQAEVIWNEQGPVPATASAAERSLKVETIRARIEAL
jgi:type II secretory pathway pseudopilin PulG